MTDSNDPAAVSSRYARGAARLAEMGGDIESIRSALADVAPDVARYVGEYAFGDIYCRPGLDLRTRQLVTIASLTTLGDTDRQLRFHVDAALNVGATVTEIVEVITQMLVFAGNPRVFNALLSARETFDRRNLLPAVAS